MLSPTNEETEFYETIKTTGHEYEIPYKYRGNRAYEISPMAEPKTEAEAVQLQPTGDYEFTQCPAYIPVATTSIHGNTDKPPSTQPTTAQDDQEDKIESG